MGTGYTETEKQFKAKLRLTRKALKEASESEFVG